jgi:AbrB family looped-hinge helix DNA binding protein
MQYTTSISSKGQITIPVDARRRLGLNKKVQIEIRKHEVVLRQPPSMENVWKVLSEPSRGAGLSNTEKNNPRVSALIQKEKLKRGC